MDISKLNPTSEIEKMKNMVNTLFYRVFILILSISLISSSIPLQAQTQTPLSPSSNSTMTFSLPHQSTANTWNFLSTIGEDDLLLDETKPTTISYRQIDTWTLLPQEIKKHPSAGRMQIENITVRIKHIYDDDRQSVHYMNNLSAKTLNPSHPQSPFYTGEEDFIPQFEMLYQGEDFFSFNKEIATINRYGQYIVFVTQDHIYKDHLQLSFIDLSYFRSTLGRADGYPAIFQMPVPLDQPFSSMTIQNGLLKINDYEISSKMLDHFGYLQAITWNVQANLLKSQSYEDMVPLIDGFLSSIESSREFVIDMLSHAFTTEGQVRSFQRQLIESIGAAKNAIQKTKSEKKKEDITWKLTKDISTQYFIENANAQLRINSTLKLQVEARKLLGRVTLMFERLKLPQPTGGSIIRQALAFTLGSLKGPEGQKAWYIQEGIVKLIHNPRIQLGATASTALLLGAVYPKEAYQFVDQVVSFGGIVVDTIFEKFMNFYSLAQSAIQVNDFFNPKQVWKAYIGEGNTYAFVVANTVLILKILSFFAISHLTVNAFHLLSDLGKGQNLKNTSLYNRYVSLRQQHAPPVAAFRSLTGLNKNNISATAGAVKGDFIHRQDSSRHTYLIDQTQSLLDSEKRDFTQEETNTVLNILKERKQAEKSLISVFLEKVQTPLRHLKFFQNKEITDIKINTLRASIMNFIFSWKSLENTFIALTHVWWKHVFFTTSYLIRIDKPLFLIGLAYYPNAFKTITQGGLNAKNNVHPLTTANGGTRPFWRQYPLFLTKFFTKSTAHQAYKEWESLIIPIEVQIMRQVQERAFRVTLLRIRDKHLHHRVFRSSNLHEGVAAFDKEQTQFYEAVKGQLFERVFAKLISPTFEKKGCYVGDCLEYIDQYKQETLEDVKNLSLSNADIENAMNEVEADGFYQAIEVNLNRQRTTNPIQNLIYKTLYKVLDHRNNLVKRWLVIEAQMQDAGAKARATRKSFYDFIAKIPQLYIMWAAVSGIMLQAIHGDIASTDIMVPLTDQYPYYSQYLFGAGFFIIVVLDLMRNFGAYLEREYKLKKEGIFNYIPEGANVHLGFIRWFLRQMRDKKNTFLANTKTIFRMAWFNTPSYFVKFTLIYGLTLGRFPLDVYLTGYLLYYLFPVKGFDSKVDHAMEAAMSGYWMKYFPNHLRGHYLAQDYALKKKGQYRAVFQFFFTFLYGNILYATIENFQMMGVNTSRQFSRMLFGGHPPTVWAVRAFDMVRESLGGLPLVGAITNSVIDACETALTNGYDGWDPRVDGQPPDHIKPWIPGNK